MKTTLNKKGVWLAFSFLLLIGFLGVLSSSDSQALEWGLDEDADKDQINEIMEDVYRKKSGRDEIPPEEYKKQTVKQGGIVLKNKEYPLEHYEGLSTAGGLDLGKTNLIGFSNSLFWLSKFVYQGIDHGLTLMSGQTILDDWVDTTLSLAKALWDQAVLEYLLPMMVVMAFVLLWQLVAELNLLKGLKTIAVFVGVFVLASFFFQYGGTVIKGVNASNDSIQSSILAVGTMLTGDSEEIPEDQTKEGVTAIIRNTYFNLAVYRPYLLMNYGTTDAEKLTKDDPDRLDNLLKRSRISLYTDGLKAAVKEEAGEGNNDYMSDSDVGVNSKFGMSIGSLVLALGVGIPLLVLALANFLVQLMVLACVLVLGISFFVSLIPQFRKSFVKPLVKGVGLILSQAFLVVFLLFVLLIMTILDSVVPPTTSGGFLVNSLLLAFILWFLLKKRDEIVSMITGGRVQLQTNQSKQVFQGAQRWLQHRGLRRAFQRGQQPTSSGNEPKEEQPKQAPKTPPRYRVVSPQSQKRSLHPTTDPSTVAPTREVSAPNGQRRIGQSKRSQAPIGKRPVTQKSTRPLSPLRTIPVQKKRPLVPHAPRGANQSPSRRMKRPEEQKPSLKKPEAPTKTPRHPNRQLPPKPTTPPQSTKTPATPKMSAPKPVQAPDASIIKRRPTRNERRQ